MVGAGVVLPADKHRYADPVVREEALVLERGRVDMQLTSTTRRTSATEDAGTPLAPRPSTLSVRSRRDPRTPPVLARRRPGTPPCPLRGAPPENKYIDMNDVFLTNAAAGRVVHRWYGANEDLDARRIIPKNAALCGGAIYHANCFMTGKLTRTRALHAGLRTKSVDLRHRGAHLLQDDSHVRHGGRARRQDARHRRRVHQSCPRRGYRHFRFAGRRRLRSIRAGTSCRRGVFGSPLHQRTQPNGYGIGSIKFDIAAEMSPSLKGLTC